MDKLNNEVDPMLVEFIMQICSRGSYDRHRIGILGNIPDSVQSIEDFIDYLDQRWASFPGRIAEELKRDGNVLTARLFKCSSDFVNPLKELVPKIY